MTRHVFSFLATFVLGALIALGARTATHRPHVSPPAPSADPHSEHAAAPADPHAAHRAPAPSTPPVPNLKSEISDLKSQTPVNTHCAICGMEVDPKLPTLTYQGKTIGFGCKLCPPKFQAEPDRYGPLYLRNEVIKR